MSVLKGKLKSDAAKANTQRCRKTWSVSRRAVQPMVVFREREEVLGLRIPAQLWF